MWDGRESVEIRHNRNRQRWIRGSVSTRRRGKHRDRRKKER